MRRSRSVHAIAWLTAWALFSGTVAPIAAHAQGRPAAAAKAKKKPLRDSLTGEAKKAFDRGVELYKAGNFEGALAEFERAYADSKDARLLFNMAVSERDRKRYSRAVGYLEQELKEGAETLSDAEKKTAQEVLEGLKQYTATLTITVNEPGATVLVDGVEVGKSPLAQPLTVDVGERVIVVKKQTFLEATKRINVSGGTTPKAEFTLEASEKKGKLVVKATGAPVAMVFVDGIEQGPAPWEGDVVADKQHTVEIRAKGFVTETRSEIVAISKPSIIEVTLRPEQGRVRIETDKPENVISIDGKEVGRGTWEGVVSSGGHQLTVTRNGAEPYSSDLAVQTDQQRVVKVNLRAKGGTAWYWWVAGGAVLVGGGIATYFLAKPKTEDPQPGTINPGTVPVRFRF